jgi:hypothetical protein
MEPGKVPVPIVWPYDGSEVYVTGEFNTFSLTLLTGDKEKFCVVWCNPGSYLYRFCVDGSYTCDPNKPTLLSENVTYNQFEVADLPEPISNLQQLSLEELEKLDSQLFERPEIELDRRLHKLKGFLRKVVQRKKFLKIRNAAIIVQAWVKGMKQRRRYKKFKEFWKWREKEKCDKETMTEDLEESKYEKMKKIIEEMKEEIENLKKTQEVKKKALPRKVDPPLISIKAFMTPSKPLNFRDQKVDLTPKNKPTGVKIQKK